MLELIYGAIMQLGWYKSLTITNANRTEAAHVVVDVNIAGIELTNESGRSRRFMVDESFNFNFKRLPA